MSFKTRTHGETFLATMRATRYFGGVTRCDLLRATRYFGVTSHDAICCAQHRRSRTRFHSATVARNAARKVAPCVRAFTYRAVFYATCLSVTPRHLDRDTRVVGKCCLVYTVVVENKTYVVFQKDCGSIK